MSSDLDNTKIPRARNTHELSFFISFEHCPSCGSRLDESLFWLSAATDTGAAKSGKCGACHKPLGFSFLGGNLLKAHSGNWDEVAPGRTEILRPWKLAAEIDLLSPKVHDDPTKLDVKQWQHNRDINKRILLCAHELLKLLDAEKEAIAHDLLDAEDLHYREQHPEWFARIWIEESLKRHRQIVEANIQDLPRINQLEAQTKYRRSKKSRPGGSAGRTKSGYDSDRTPI